jgi:hypothetical protein
MAWNSFEKLKVSASEYNEIYKTISDNKAIIREQIHGSRKTLYADGIMVAICIDDSGIELGGITNRQFTAFLAQFTKNLYAQFSKNEKLYYLKVDNDCYTRNKNENYWNTIPVGHYLYNVDLKSAYWQLAYQLGYISTNFFEKYIKLDEYKQAKRLCISFLARGNSMTYQRIGEPDYVIYCNGDVLQRVYDNIRKKLYQSVQFAIGDITDYIEYNIDGITVTAKDLDAVKSRFIKLGLDYKVSEMKKISQTEYLKANKKRKFVSTNNLITQ